MDSNDKGPAPVKLRELKARAQRLEATLKVGKNGLSPAFIESLSTELDRHRLVKIKFTEFKDQKKTLAPQLAEATGAQLVMRVGNVAVYYREPKEGAAFSSEARAEQQ